MASDWTRLMCGFVSADGRECVLPPAWRLATDDGPVERCELHGPLLWALRELDSYLDFSHEVQSGMGEGLNFLDASGINAAFRAARQVIADAEGRVIL